MLSYDNSMLDCLGRGEFSLLSLVCSAALAICAAQASKGMGVTGTGSTLSKRQRQTGAEQACQRARVCAGATQGTHAQGSDAFKGQTVWALTCAYLRTGV